MLKIQLANELGFSQELPLSNKSIQLSTGLNYLEIDATEDDALEYVMLNGSIVELESVRGTIVPCRFEMDQTCEVQIKSGQHVLRYAFTYADACRIEEQTVQAIADFHRRVLEWLGDGPSSPDHVIRGIQEGHIPLLHILDPLTGIDDQSILEEIEAALPFALNICTRPRQHLRAEEEILDVELVKRVGPAALQHLASHSEHWRARTITGLVPSRLRADVYEDDFNIYENLFFRMVIEKLLSIIGEKDAEIMKALAQKNALIDWDRYGHVVKDYKRSEFLYKLLPDYDYEAEELVKGRLEEMRIRLKRLERLLTTIVSTSFYQGIDRNRRLELPVRPTNIIQMDRRYYEMFKLWNRLLQHENSKKTQDNATPAVINPEQYYQSFVQILLLYSMHLMGSQFEEESKVLVTGNGAIRVSVALSERRFQLSCRSVTNRGGTDGLEIKLTERLRHDILLPKSCEIDHVSTELIQYADLCEWSGADSMRFLRKPTPAEERALGNLFKNFRENNPQFTGEQKYKIDTMDKAWRKWLSEEFLKIKECRTYAIHVQSAFVSIGHDEIDIRKQTLAILNGGLVLAKSRAVDQTIFALPMDLSKHMNLKSKYLARRLINYGEAYLSGDAADWGDYRVGMLPVSQTEVQSAQRLIKLLTLNISKKSMEWGMADISCPSCGSEQVEAIDKTSFRCRNDSCHVQWGTTRCKAGCGSPYEWINPLYEPGRVNLGVSSPLEEILQMESMFGRLTVTDFELVEENDQTKLIPRCPKCGVA